MKTFEQVHDELVALSGNRCAICGNPETYIDTRTGKVHRLSLDHDHVTGQVRGILCRRCNTMIGKINDDISILARAIDYIHSAASRLADQTGKHLKVSNPGRVLADYRTGRRKSGWQKGYFAQSASGTWFGKMYVKAGNGQPRQKLITFSGMSESEARVAFDRLLEEERLRRITFTDDRTVVSLEVAS